MTVSGAVRIGEETAPHECSYHLAAFANVCAACVAAAAAIEFGGIYASLEIENRARSLDRGGTPSESIEEGSTRLSKELQTDHILGLHQSTVGKAVYFTSCTMLSRIADSFEWYLRRIIEHIIDSNPRIMANREQSNSPEFEITVSSLIDHYNEDFSSLKNEVKRQYLDKLLAGPAYSKAVGFLEKKINGKQQILSKDDMVLLQHLFILRNSITHEEGRLPQQSLDVLTQGTTPSELAPFNATSLIYTARDLSRMAMKIERVVARGYHSPAVHVCDEAMISGILARSWDVAALFLNR